MYLSTPDKRRRIRLDNGRALSIVVISEKMESANQVQILDKAIYISLWMNALGKDLNPSSSSSY